MWDDEYVATKKKLAGEDIDTVTKEASNAAIILQQKRKKYRGGPPITNTSSAAADKREQVRRYRSKFNRLFCPTCKARTNQDPVANSAEKIRCVSCGLRFTRAQSQVAESNFNTQKDIEAVLARRPLMPDENMRESLPNRLFCPTCKARTNTIHGEHNSFKCMGCETEFELGNSNAAEKRNIKDRARERSKTKSKSKKDRG